MVENNDEDAFFSQISLKALRGEAIKFARE